MAARDLNATSTTCRDSRQASPSALQRLEGSIHSGLSRGVECQYCADVLASGGDDVHGLPRLHDLRKRHPIRVPWVLPVGHEVVDGATCRIAGPFVVLLGT